MSTALSHATDLERDARALRAAVTDLVRVYEFRDRDRICCYDVSVRQSNALDTLVERGALSLNELAAALYVDKSTASRVVDALEKKGYVDRRTNPANRRSVLIDATARGRILAERIEDDLLEQEMRLLAEFDPEARRAAARVVARLARAAAARVDASAGSCCSI